MSTAISLRGTRNVVLRNVGISGFQRGIEAIDSNMLLDRVSMRNCGVGLDLVNSHAAIHDSQFIDNAVDIIMNRSTISMIDTLASRILRIIPKDDYRINPYLTAIKLQDAIRTNDVKKKKQTVREIIDNLKYLGYGWIIFQILRDILRFIGWI